MMRRVSAGICLKEKANAAGEYVTFNREAGIITVTAKEYSTFAFSYNEDSGDEVPKGGHHPGTGDSSDTTV